MSTSLIEFDSFKLLSFSYNHFSDLGTEDATKIDQRIQQAENKDGNLPYMLTAETTFSHNKDFSSGRINNILEIIDPVQECLYKIKSYCFFNNPNSSLEQLKAYLETIGLAIALNKIDNLISQIALANGYISELNLQINDVLEHEKAN